MPAHRPPQAGAAYRLASDTHRLSTVLLVLAAIVVVTSLGVTFDRLLLTVGVPRWETLIVSNGLTGLAVGILSVQSRRRDRENQRLAEERLAKLADMNHHVRNALQVVAFFGIAAADSKATQLVREAIQRIEWTLREVLPRGWELPELGSTAPRIDAASQPVDRSDDSHQRIAGAR